MHAFRLGVEITQINKSVLKRVAALGWPLARVTRFKQGDGTLWRQMHAPIERHDFLDRGRAEIDVVVSFQITLDAEPTGIAVFLLQRQHRVNGAEVDLTLWLVWRTWQIRQWQLSSLKQGGLLVGAAQPFADGLARGV